MNEIEGPYEVHQTLDVPPSAVKYLGSMIHELTVKCGASVDLNHFYNEAVGYQRSDVVTESTVFGWVAAYRLANEQREALDYLGFDVVRTKIEGLPWTPTHDEAWQIDRDRMYYETHIKAMVSSPSMPLTRPGLWSRNARSQQWTVTLRSKAPPEPTEYTLQTHLMDVGVQMGMMKSFNVPWLGEPRTELVLLDTNRELDADWEKSSCA